MRMRLTITLLKGMGIAGMKSVEVKGASSCEVILFTTNSGVNIV